MEWINVDYDVARCFIAEFCRLSNRKTYVDL